jgi:N-acyl-D-amino-acid deacylase
LTAYDIILRNGTIIDGTNSPRFVGDVAITGDRIATVAQKIEASADVEIDVSGLIVAPGFVNMLSWSVESLILDGRGLSGITQGVTTEIMGEGWSMGPLNERLRSSGKP